MPTGVLIDKFGNVKTIFSKTNVTYDLCADDIKDALASSKSLVKKLIAPNPPFLELAGTNILSMKWDFVFPPGLSQQVELQYISANLVTGLRSSISPETDGPRLVKRPRESQWQLLVTRSWCAENFDSFIFNDLPPGTGFYFRIRTWSHEGWSPYSEMSSLMRTFATRPSQPGAPIIAVSMATCMQLRWSRASANGSKIKWYILRAQSEGGDYEEVYRGPLNSYLVMSLRSDFEYTFDVAAENEMGLSEFSPVASGQTTSMKDAGSSIDSPQMIAAMKCREAWSECWDPRTEQYFYFNSLTGVRQLSRPAVMDVEDGSTSTKVGDVEVKVGAVEEIDVKKQADMTFRRKRFRLLKSIHQHSATLRRKHDSDPSSPSKPQRDLFQVELRRSHLLYDGYKSISKAPTSTICNRLKVTFKGRNALSTNLSIHTI